MIIIKDLLNGYTLTNKTTGEMWVFQESDDDPTKAMVELLWCLVDSIGPDTNRYSDKRIHIDVRPGDKWESKAL